MYIMTNTYKVCEVKAKLLKAFSALLLLSFSYSTQASVILGKTRVIYPSQEKQVTATLRNLDEQNALVQTWISSEKDNKSIVPFVITPPLTKVNAKTSQEIRIAYTREDLPTDRETLFYFHILTIPSQDPELKKLKLKESIAIKNVYKLFYRPESLKSSLEDTVQNLKFDISNGLQIKNNTPHYFTLRDTTLLDSDGKSFYLGRLPMLAPFSTTDVKTDKIDLTTIKSVKFAYLNDGGREVKHSIDFNQQ